MTKAAEKRQRFNHHLLRPPFSRLVVFISLWGFRIFFFQHRFKMPQKNICKSHRPHLQRYSCVCETGFSHLAVAFLCSSGRSYMCNCVPASLLGCIKILTVKTYECMFVHTTYLKHWNIWMGLFFHSSGPPARFYFLVFFGVKITRWHLFNLIYNSVAGCWICLTVAHTQRIHCCANISGLYENRLYKQYKRMSLKG